MSTVVELLEYNTFIDLSQLDLSLNFSAYQVIVLKFADGAEELPNDFDLKLKDNANKDNLNFYIAAEIENNPVHEESWKFSVGDDKKYGDYVNKGLERGEKYIIYQRAATRDNGVSKHESVSSSSTLMTKRQWHLRHRYNWTYCHALARNLRKQHQQFIRTYRIHIVMSSYDHIGVAHFVIAIANVIARLLFTYNSMDQTLFKGSSILNLKLFPCFLGLHSLEKPLEFPCDLEKLLKFQMCLKNS